MTRRHELAALLRQMIAALQGERQALAALDIDALTGASASKLALCTTLEGVGIADTLDPECRALAQSAHQLNETNRRMRNILSHNVSERLDLLTGHRASYRVRGGRRTMRSEGAPAT